MAEENLKSKTLNGVLWSGTNRFLNQGIGFICSILVARKLMPADYGVVAMLNIFLAISQAFIDSGFTNAIIRKKDRTEADINTVFHFNVAISLFFYALLFFTAPLIAKFYDQPLLVPVTRVVSLTLVFNALGAMQATLLTIAIDFKKKTQIGIICSILSGVVGVWMAYADFGVWAIVGQQVFGSFIGWLVTLLFVRWIPKLMFSWKSFKEMFSYGSKLLASGLLNTVYNNLSTLIVGKLYTAGDLGTYSKAKSLAGFPSTNITGILQSVSFPVLSTIQDQPERLANYYKKFINLAAFVIFPIMIGFSAVADPFIRIVLTDKWEGAIYLLQISCFSAMWYPIHAINLNLLQVLGRSDYFLKLEIIKKIWGLCVLAATVPFGVVAMCYGSVFSSIVCLFINTYYTKKLVGYGFVEQMKSLFHILIHSLIMGVLAWLVVRSFDNLWLKLVLGTLTGMMYYFAGAYIFKFPEFSDLMLMLKEKLHKA